MLRHDIRKLIDEEIHNAPQYENLTEDFIITLSEYLAKPVSDWIQENYYRPYRKENNLMEEELIKILKNFTYATGGNSNSTEEECAIERAIARIIPLLNNRLANTIVSLKKGE